MPEPDLHDSNIQQTEQFAAALTELAGFQEYFTDDEKSKLLVNWVSEECNVSKVTARLLIKHIAPFVLARLADLGKAVGSAWLRKLHGKFSTHSGYLNFTLRLLNTLKTRTDRSYETALDSPATVNLEQVIGSPHRWENLKDEQKATIQLLLGQNEISEGIDVVRQHIDRLIKSLAFDLDLKSPRDIEQRTKDAELGSAAWLTYTHRQARLIGRDNELQQLTEFLDQDAGFSWWLISGPGGVGKSRLALESLIEHQHLWDGGFLPDAKLKTPDALAGWQPSMPTLIIVDYAAAHAATLADWLEYLIQHQDAFDFPVRLLLLEREYREQNWWKELIPATSGGTSRQLASFQNPHELKPLALAEQRTALQRFLDAMQVQTDLPETDDLFWQSLHELSNEGRPLFIAMAAVAIARHGINHVRRWDQEQLLIYVANHERLNWQQQIKTAGLGDYQDKIISLLMLSTVTAGFDDAADEEYVYTESTKLKLFADDELTERCLGLLPTLTGHPAGYLKPDIFAEYVVLKHWAAQPANKGLKRSARLQLGSAYAIAPENTATFIHRSAVDYPEDETSWYWWQTLAKSEASEQPAMDKLAFNVVEQLSLHGRYNIVLQRWLPVLADSTEEKNKARAIDLIGKQYFHIGNYHDASEYFKQSLAIRQEIGDKPGEGTTLNNISQTFKARGDYDTALEYLKQSLAIRQDIGDKSGDGATLNNISQIYDARGDYDTALDYLKQSLSIFKEIGDLPGVGTTLNNISLIFKARGDYETALDYLKQSLAIRQEIGDLPGEGTTLNNMATNAHACGDYGTALDYLKRVHAIDKEIGDKSGEGTTLNNISQIYDARGDYNTALGYLKQSLAIQQEIGNVAGICGTTINIACIHWQNKEPEHAMASWSSAYLIAKKIGHAKALATLEKWRKYLEIPDGWEAIAQQQINANSE